MLQKFMLSQKTWEKILIGTIASVLLSLATFGFLLCCAAFVIIRIDTPEYVLIPLTTSLLTFSSFLDSFILAKLFKEKGIIIGFFIGVIFISIVLIAAAFYHTFAVTGLLISKLSAILLAGILGGVLGVNS